MWQSALLGAAFMASSAQAQVVISQVYGGGGNTGATYRNDFIELHNNGSTSVDLTGWSVQYASATGTTWQRTNLSGSIAPGGYFLVQQAQGTGGTTNLPTPDATGTIAMSGTAGKVILVDNQTTQTGACPTGAAIKDTVGFGTTANCSETAPTPAPSNTLAVLRADSGCTDTGNNSTDFATGAPNPRNSASAAFVCGGGSTPVLSINDVSVFEGDSGTTTATFTVSLNIPAGPGGVGFDIATANGTASAGSDYLANALAGQSIPAGAQTYIFNVTINGDTIAEANETYFVNVSNVSGALVGDAQGLGTIQNDDVTVVQIHDIQGNGLSSPINGAIVTTEGIVTAQKFNNGFFLQTADASVDADPNTSQGIFVFTSTAPPATAAVGNRIRVTGTVGEFTPSTNLNQLSITQIASVTSIQVLSTGNPLPVPVALSATDFGATATPGTAEKFEGMRVTVPSARVVAASDGNITESSATSSSTGVFHVVLDGVDRPFREPGIGVLDVFPIPGGKTPPRFDTNQERLMVRSRGQVGATALALDVDATVTNITGVMDYFSGTWALLPDVGSGTTAGGKVATSVPDRNYDQVSIGAFNLLRFFDEINDSNGAPTLQAAALDKRLTKTSIAICDNLKAPDILGVVEVENLRVLGLLGDRINSTCARAPQYVPYLVQGNDQGGINVGFLVSSRIVTGTTARVEVLEVTQFGKDTLFVNPDSSTSLLNDRPPLLLRAVVRNEHGAYPVTVIVNHLRSLNGVDDTGPGSGGWASEGHRVRAKRGQQALFLADFVHARQVADPNERIVLVGDFNAFEFNDGYTDVLGIIRGEAAAEPEVVNFVASPITDPLIDGSVIVSDPAERYSYVFAGSAQTLDHVLVNEGLFNTAGNLEVHHARINADFGVHHFGIAGTPIRTSDHDPVVLYVTAPELRVNDDLYVIVAGVEDSISAAQTPAWGVEVGNTSTTLAAQNVELVLTLSGDATGVGIDAAGWDCLPGQAASGDRMWTCGRSGDLAPNTRDYIGFVKQQSYANAGQVFTLKATVSASSPADSNPSNNVDRTTISVYYEPGPSVEGGEEGGPYETGGTLPAEEGDGG